jgi:hypothetical protein
MVNVREKGGKGGGNYRIRIGGVVWFLLGLQLELGEGDEVLWEGHDK